MTSQTTQHELANALTTRIKTLTSDRQQLGQLGEMIAARYLELRGYRVIERNWRNAQGEIDLIVAHGDAVIAVEVKTRSGRLFGHPFESITIKKIRRLRGLLAAWCSEHNTKASHIRLDAIAIVREPGRRTAIEHIKGIESWR